MEGFILKVYRNFPLKMEHSANYIILHPINNALNSFAPLEFVLLLFSSSSSHSVHTMAQFPLVGIPNMSHYLHSSVA